jgi:hypothetical protein
MKPATSLLACVLLLLGTGACGSSSAPGEDVPRLSMLLERVDSALADENYRGARAALRSLIRVTTEARDAGDLEDAEAADILAAAGTLIVRLPEPTPAPTPVDPSPPASSNPGDKGEGTKDDDKKDDKNGEGKKDESKGRGNGESGENGPDNGHGN